MKMKLLILLTVLVVALKCGANERELSEVTDLILKNQDNLLSDEHWRAHGQRFVELMDLIGREESMRNKDEISRLNPAIYEDRIRLIALYRFQHQDLFGDIYKHYVKHPTDAEIKKIVEVHMTQNPPVDPPDKISDEALKKLPEAKDKGSPAVLADPRFRAPHSIQESHLAAQYRFCFEYFWMAPIHEQAMRKFRSTLELALDHFKKEAGGADVRELIKAKKMNPQAPK